MIVTATVNVMQQYILKWSLLSVLCRNMRIIIQRNDNNGGCYYNAMYNVATWWGDLEPCPCEGGGQSRVLRQAS